MTAAVGVMSGARREGVAVVRRSVRAPAPATMTKATAAPMSDAGDPPGLRDEVVGANVLCGLRGIATPLLGVPRGASSMVSAIIGGGLDWAFTAA